MFLQLLVRKQCSKLSRKAVVLIRMPRDSSTPRDVAREAGGSKGPKHLPDTTELAFV